METGLITIRWFSMGATHSFVQWNILILMLIFFIHYFLVCLNTSFLQNSVHSLSLLCLLLWFFLFCHLICLPPWQKVVRDESCKEVCSHASISSQYQTQRLHQHEQTEHVHRRPVVQLHSIILRGFHDSKKIHQCHCWVEGQLHHDAQDRMLPRTGQPLNLTDAHVLEKDPLRCIFKQYTWRHTHLDQIYTQSQTRNPSELWRWI